MADQLEMNMAAGNAFADALREGRFSVVLECGTPSEPATSASVRGRDEVLARKVGELDAVTGVSMADGMPVEDVEGNPADRAAQYLQHSGNKPVVLHVSGKGSDGTRIRNQLSRAHAVGVRSMLAVTGDRSIHHPSPRVLGHIPAYVNGYMDSVRILSVARSKSVPDRCLGAAVNPHKYHPADVYVQYFKAVRKIACGATYLVAQAGWDMRKFQELQWVFQMRDFSVPVLARVLLLNGQDIRGLPDSLPPGVPVSRSLAAQFQRECTVNETQSLAAQAQRIALQVAGLRLMGYNGVQLAGIHDPHTLEMLVKRIGTALKRHTDYGDWLEAWNDYHAGVQFPPVPRPFYYFRNTGGEHALYNPALSTVAECELPAPRWGERFRARLLAVASGRLMPDGIAEVTARFLCPSCRANIERLGDCEFLCISQCPKRLVYGPCGSGRPDGTCEFGKGPCFFHRVLAMANVRRHLDRLEEHLPHD